MFKPADDWPRDELETLGRCPLCDSAARHALHVGARDWLYDAPGTWTLWRCEGCRAGYLDPRPDRESIVRAYRNYYTHDVAPPIEAPTDLRSRLRLGFSNDYRNARFGSRLTPACFPGRWIVRSRPGLCAQIDAQVRHLPNLRGGRQRVLDVGCGNGDFLRTASQMGWDVAGCDFDPVVVANARAEGFNVRTGGIECFADHPSGFDYISFSHVIEHLHDPRDALETAYNLVAPGGTVYLETPNVDSRGHGKFGDCWRGLEPPRHLVLFNPAGLVAMLRDTGWVAIKEIDRSEVTDWMNCESAALVQRAGGACRQVENPSDMRGDEFIRIIAERP